MSDDSCEFGPDEPAPLPYVPTPLDARCGKGATRDLASANSKVQLVMGTSGLARTTEPAPATRRLGNAANTRAGGTERSNGGANEP
jgi:hypothetical protein